MSVARNNSRFDLSDRLIHFFRSIDTHSESVPPLPDFGSGNVAETQVLPPLFMLRYAIRSSMLWATWSVRNGVRTIYGVSPAVCFSDMPLAAFVESGEARAQRGEAMSAYGLVFSKKAMFELGARPVIYGLDDPNVKLPPGKNGAPRLIPVEHLPLREQYRYVTHFIGGRRPIDWTHEREWRWPYREPTLEAETADTLDVAQSVRMPGLDITDPNLSGIGAVVQRSDEASWVAHDMLMMVDRGLVAPDHYGFILSTDTLPSTQVLASPAQTANAVSAAAIDLGDYLKVEQHRVRDFNLRFDRLVYDIASANTVQEVGERGGCWLWLLDNTNDLTRALLHSGRVRVSAAGRYLADLSEFGCDSRGLRQRETMTTALAAAVTSQFGLEADYFSVLGSSDFDRVPFYCNAHVDNRMFYNLSYGD